MSRLLILLPLAWLVLSSGCVRGEDDSGETGSQGMTMPAGEQTEPAQSLPPVVYVRLRVWTLEVPAGLASRSEDLWSYLDEEPIGAERQAALGRNGLRVGTAPAEAWDNLSELLREMTIGEMRSRQLVSLPGRPVDVMLKEDIPAATIFTSRDDRTLTGADYPGGDYILTFTATVDVQNPSFVLLTAVPQIRSRQRRARYVGEGENYRLVVSAERTSFENLMFRLRLSENDIMVIGPGTQSRRSTSVGRNLLVRRSEGMAFEKLLVVRPELSLTRR